MSEFASSSQWIGKFLVGILGFRVQNCTYHRTIILIFVFRFHCILFFHSTRYAEEIKRTNLVGEINSQEGPWELKQHMTMIWDDSDVESLVINGHTSCTAVLLLDYLFTTICHVNGHLMWEYICYKVLNPVTLGKLHKLEPRDGSYSVYEQIRNACWKIGIKAIKGTDLGGKQTLLDFLFLKMPLKGEKAWLPAVVQERSVTSPLDVTWERSRNQSLLFLQVHPTLTAENSVVFP